METARVNIKGQIVIPAKLRKQIGLKTGSRVFIEEKQGDIIIHPATSAFYEEAYGYLQGSALTKTLEKMRHMDGEHETGKIKKNRTR